MARNSIERSLIGADQQDDQQQNQTDDGSRDGQSVVPAASSLARRPDAIHTVATCPRF